MAEVIAGCLLFSRKVIFILVQFRCSLLSGLVGVFALVWLGFACVDLAISKHYGGWIFNLDDLSSLLKSLLRPRSITFRQLLWLVFPSLAVGLLLRTALMWAIPVGYFGDDSFSYYEFSQRLFDEGIVDLNEKRRWLYPIFLAFVDLLPGPGWTAVPLIQHLIGLFTVLGIGWCSAQLAIRPLIVVPLVTALAAIWPRTLWYEHEFIAESWLLAAFVAVLALLLTPGIVRSRYGLIALMFAFVLLAGMKGSGRFLWMGSVMSLFLLHQNPRRWLWGKISLVMAAISIFFVATIGKSAQGDWLALSSALPLVRIEGDPYPHYRNDLKPQIFEARQYGDDYPWVVKVYKKRLSTSSPDVIGPDWVQLKDDNQKFSTVSRAFWVDGVLRQPVRFAGMTWKTMLIALSGSILNPRLDPQQFWQRQEGKIMKRWRREPQYFNRLFGMEHQSFRPSLFKSKNRQFAMLPVMFWLDRHLSWLGRSPISSFSGTGSKGGFPSFVPQPLGVTALLGMVFGAVCSRKNLQCFALFLPLVLYMFGTFAVGDAVRRYLQPVEWIGFIFVGVFFDRLIHFGCDMLSAFKAQRAAF